MLAELVFVTRLLGLAAGETEVVLRSSSDVHRVEILREGERLATLAAPPWRTKVQLGVELGPYELTAVGLDANGVEVARDSLLVNVALPEATAGIQLARAGGELTARLEWWHVDGFEPLMATLKLDGSVISRKRTNRPVPLGKITDSSVHVVSVELRFPDGRQARREIAFGGVFSEEMPVELTAIGVRQRVAGSPSAAACFQLPGREERSAPVGVEHGTAIVLFVHNGDEPAWVRNDTANRRGVFALSGAEIGVVSPRLQQNADASFFDSGRVPSELGTLVAIKARQRRVGLAYLAEALAATGMRLAGGDRRRAIVYVLGLEPEEDASRIEPAAVRRYLQHIGVPLHVWSLTGPNADLEKTWGPVKDVSSAMMLAQATSDLREDLATQRIAWFAASPLDVYRATASPDCAYVPLE